MGHRTLVASHPPLLAPWRGWESRLWKRGEVTSRGLATTVGATVHAKEKRMTRLARTHLSWDEVSCQGYTGRSRWGEGQTLKSGLPGECENCVEEGRRTP